MRSRLSLAAALLLAAGCQPTAPTPAPRVNEESQPKPEKIAAAHLPNAYRLHDKVISGGQPEGEEGFRELQELGVKTVISVDGAQPDVETARKYGLRYVHLPHGYDGIPEERGRELAKAVRDLEGPVYIHCHHGKHRSPAAATVACVSVGFLPPEAAEDVLKTAGTSENYRGLYQSAQRARRLDDALLDELEVEFRETVEIPPLAEAMVEIEHAFDRLKLIAESEWMTPPEHPDLEPAHEALLLREQFTELLRTPAAMEQPEEFLALLRDSELAAEALEEALRDTKGENDGADPRVAAWDRIQKNCRACHEGFRDVPLGEK